MSKDNLIISFEGIGSSGKTTQAAMLAGSFWSKYNTAVHKMINRKMLQATLKPFSRKPVEKLWVAQLPQVEEGTDMLVYMALMKQRYAEILEELGGKPHIVLLGRYIDSVFAHAATRIVLGAIAAKRRLASNDPESLSKLIYADSQREGLQFEPLVDKVVGAELKACAKKVETLYAAFSGLRNTVRWPDMTIVLDVPVSKMSEREARRENRAFSQGDMLYFTITSRAYRFLKRKEPKRIYLVDGYREREAIAKEIFGLVTKKFNLSKYRKKTKR
jgi:thymidylate kinase